MFDIIILHVLYIYVYVCACMCVCVCVYVCVCVRVLCVRKKTLKMSERKMEFELPTEGKNFSPKSSEKNTKSEASL